MSYAIIWRRIIFCRLLVTFTFSKTLMVLLICVAFAGQTMASTIMSYQMMSMKLKVTSNLQNIILTLNDVITHIFIQWIKTKLAALANKFSLLGH